MARRYDSIQLSKTARLDADGYLYDTPVLTLAEKIFTYRLPDGTIRREYRPATEVFNKDSLASFKGRPITIKHPQNGHINAGNIKELSVGTILSEGRQDGDKLVADIVIHNPEAINDKRELSLGYDLDKVPVKGVTAAGEAYDVIQKNIRVNHLAIVDRARAGRQARLNLDDDEIFDVEDAPAATEKQTKKEAQTMSEEIKIKGISYEVPPQVAVELKEKEALIEQLQGQITTLEGEKEALEIKNKETEDTMQQNNQDAEDKFNVAVKERIKLLDSARKINLDKADEMTDSEIKTAVIKHVNKDSIDLKDKSDEYINTAFDFSLAALEKETMSKQRQTVNNDSADTSVTTSSVQSRQTMIADLKNGGKK